MPTSPSNIDEQRRLTALRELNILDTAPEPEFEALVNAAALVCGTPISLISLVESDRQWFKANVGLPGVHETSRDVSFCAHALQDNELMEVEDARSDPRFADNLLVTGDPGIRFYAGIPLALLNGENVGTLCVIDRQPRTLTQNQRDILTQLGYAAARALEARVAVEHERQLLKVESLATSILEHSVDAIVTVGLDGIIQHWNQAAERLFGFRSDEIVGQSINVLLPEGLDSEGHVASRLAKTGSLGAHETKRLNRSGLALDVSVTLGPVYSPAGDVVAATEIIRDIRSNLETRKALKLSEDRLRRLYEATPSMMHSIDMSGRMVSVSDRWLHVLGYRREEVLGRMSVDFLAEASKRYASAVVLPEFFRTGRCDQIEYQMVSKSGDIVDVLLSAVLEKDADGNPFRTMAVIEDVRSRRSAERALAEERKRLENIIQGTQAGTWEWNVQTGEMRCNEQWAANFGWSLEDLQPVSIKTWEGHVHPDDLYASADYLQDHFDGKDAVYEFETRMRHLKGHWVWVVDRGRVLSWTADGKPEWMFGTSQNINLRKLQEQSLQKSQEFLDRTGQVAGIGGWEVDLRTGQIDWSTETCRIHGVEAGYRPQFEEAINFYAPEARPVIEAAVQRSIATGEGWDLELALIKANGERVWVRAVGSADVDGGRPVRLSGAFQDITQRVKERLALEEANERIAIATENGSIGIWDADLENGQTYYSEMWCNLLGYTRSEIQDSLSRWLEFVHPDDRDRAKSADLEHIAGRTPYFEEQFRMKHKDGHWVWILDRGRVVERDGSGKPRRMIGTHTDITRQKEAEQERAILGERMAIAAESGGIGIWDVDLIHDTVSWDPWMYRLWGLPERSGKRPSELWNRHVHPEDLARIELAVLQAVNGIKPLNEEYRINWPDHSLHYIRVSAKVISDEQGKPARLIGAAWDVTRERQMALEIAEQHELMRVTLHSIGDAVITTNSLGIVQWLNPVAERMTGWTAEEAVGQEMTRVFNIVNEETRQRAPDPIAACLELVEVVGLDKDTVLIARDGREFAIEDSAAPIRRSTGEVLGAVLVFHDVSEQRRLTREMSHRASHDALTGLINRAEFDRRLSTVFNKPIIAATSNVLLYIDLDQFKIVNDSCGHSAGDELLKLVSRLISDTVRSGDTLARLGGDEFAVILEQCSIGNAHSVAQKICDKMSDFRYVHDGKRFRVGTSIGLVPIDGTLGSTAAILQAADASCYAAKEAGRNRVHVWLNADAKLLERSGEMRWASRIEEALDEDRFVLYIQDIAPLHETIEQGRHGEILLRMADEAGNLIQPGAFLPSAERFNLATRIDKWVLGKTVAWIADFDGSKKIDTICVNLSGQSVGDRSFHRDVLTLLDAAGDDVCSRLCLEITETAAVTNLADATIFIDQVRKLGVRIALDDFGAGASSFGYLKRFPVDYLKIDGQFIRDLIDDPLNDATVRCFVEVSKLLGLKTIAEFVGSADVVVRLREMGVDYGQGYHIHKPEPLLQSM